MQLYQITFWNGTTRVGFEQFYASSINEAMRSGLTRLGGFTKPCNGITVHIVNGQETN